MVAIYGNDYSIDVIKARIIKGELLTFDFESDVIDYFINLYPGSNFDDYSNRRYCYDSRIGYHVYIVTYKGNFVSFMIYL